MEINEFAKMNHERSVKNATAKFDWKYYIVALGGEAGELLNNLKKINRGDFELNKEEIAEEAAEVITYAFLLISSLDIDVEKALIDKFEKVNKRLEAGGWHKRPEKTE